MLTTTYLVMTPGERIVLARKERGLSQIELAKLAGVGQSSLSELENGQSKNPRGDTLMLVCKALQIHPQWVINGEGPKYWDHAFPMDVWQQLSESQREIIIEQIEFLLSKNK